MGISDVPNRSASVYDEPRGENRTWLSKVARPLPEQKERAPASRPGPSLHPHAPLLVLCLRDLITTTEARMNPAGGFRLALINQHNCFYADRGTKSATVQLYNGRTRVWAGRSEPLNWAKDDDPVTLVTLPPLQFDRVRVTVDRWEGNGGGLSEIQLLTPDNRNLALHARAEASAEYGGHPPAGVTDGIVTSRECQKGYWILPDNTPGWVDVHLNRR